MKIHFIHALPNSFLPTTGNRLYVVGISESDVKNVLQQKKEIVSHIRYEDFCSDLSHLLGEEIPVSGDNCPSPMGSSDMFILASRSPGSTEVSFYHLYDGSKERADYDWRYSMTEFA